LVKVDESMQNGIQFGTIRFFKELEADIVFLIGIKQGSWVCSFF
jgi:superfamily I DNA/RNA helicase